MNTEQLSPAKKTIVGVQFLFVAFGATVLVPLLIGINPATALFTAGVGTLIFHVVTKGRVPIFLGSSFAFIAPIIAATQQWGLPGTIAGLTSVSLVYFVMSALVKWQGRKLLDRLFPPVVIGPVIILIGLSLSGSAVNMAKDHWLLAFVSLITAILVLTLCRGLMKLVPILSGVAVGYIVAVCMGEVDFTGVANASWIAMPVAFDTITHFSWSPFLYMMPVAIAPVIEHIGDVYVVSAVADKDFVKDPGLHRTMLGDGLACLCSAFLGGPPETTYSEVTGAMSITKVTSPAVIRISALTAICFSVVGKLSALLQSIPQAVLGRHHAAALRHHSQRGRAEPDAAPRGHERHAQRDNHLRDAHYGPRRRRALRRLVCHLGHRSVGGHRRGAQSGTAQDQGRGKVDHPGTDPDGPHPLIHPPHHRSGKDCGDGGQVG